MFVMFIARFFALNQTFKSSYLKKVNSLHKLKEDESPENAKKERIGYNRKGFDMKSVGMLKRHIKLVTCTHLKFH